MVMLSKLTVCFSLQYGWTALHMAAREGKVDVVRLLTESEAQVNIQAEVYMIALCIRDNR